MRIQGQGSRFWPSLARTGMEADAAGQLEGAVREGRRCLELLGLDWHFETNLKDQEGKWLAYRQEFLGSWTLDVG